MEQLHFWAKTSDRDDAKPAFKSVAHHLLDVAACALRFLELNPHRLARECLLTAYPPSNHARLCAALAALHDVGKISRSFQSLCATLWPVAVLGPCPAAIGRARRHWESTAVLLNAGPVRAALTPLFGPGGLPPQLIAAIAGHHGAPPSGDDCNADVWRAANDTEIGPACVNAAANLCQELATLFPDLGGNALIAHPEPFSFLLNGLITLADWVGSDSDHFPFENPDMRMSDYWPLALTRADAALRAKGLLPAQPARVISLARLSPGVVNARPMQAIAETLDIPPEPQLIIIEDGTGSGKTEAALLLAQRMMARGLGEGIFFALPTMATANAMHHRLQSAMEALFAGDASLVLAHGKASIAAALERLEAPTADQPGEASVAAWCNGWIGDSRKKAFLADAGAGTIDQAFLSVLRKKHLSLRQYALAGRILIVDEAHACDAYMGEELKVLVDMQARLGGSIIILSATLSQSAKDNLAMAFARGRGVPGRRQKAIVATKLVPHYPLLTRWSETRSLELMPVTGDPALARRVSINRLAARKDAVQLALKSAQNGASVAIICNAVDSAINTWQDLLDSGQPPRRCHLFHARFLVDDRLAIEAQVQALFGRHSTGAQRQGRIIVATQVVEQSLDLDFDVMISDLAPVDLLIQRAGRLWRHTRIARPVQEPVLHIVSPDPKAEISSTWLNECLGPAAHVYDLPGVMWRSARDLFAKGRLDTPEDLRWLIESAYNPSSDDLPPALQQGHGASAGQAFAERSLAIHNTIKPDEGYLGLPELSGDEDIGTRLGEESVTLRLAKRAGGMLVPLNQRPGASQALNWALSEISVSGAWFQRHVGHGAPADPQVIDVTRLLWPKWERNIHLFEVADDGCLQTAEEPALIYGASGLRSIKKRDQNRNNTFTT